LISKVLIMKNTLAKTLLQFFGIAMFSVFTSLTVQAQEQNMQRDDSIYQGLGKTEGITKIVNDFIPLILADERIKSFSARSRRKNSALCWSHSFVNCPVVPANTKAKTCTKRMMG